MALDKVVTQIERLSSDPANWKQLLDFLKSEDKSLERSKAQIAGALATLDPTSHSLGYLCLLEKLPGSPREILERVRDFLLACAAEQIRLAPQKLAKLCLRLKSEAKKINSNKAAIAPLLVAIQKLGPTDEYITPVHGCLFQVCLLSKCYNAALPALNPEASEVNPSLTGLTPRDFQLYCYYGARIHIGRKCYPEALRMLLQSLTAPTMVVNAITMAAYKKYVLVSLIHYGHVSPLPKFTPSVVSRAVKGECGKYNEIVQAYGKANSNMITIVNKSRATIEADRNWGLLQLALEARTKRAVQRLTQTYLTLSLQQIGEAVGLPSAAEAELCILKMIDSGDIFAEIDDVRGMVHFQEDPEEYCSPETMTRLNTQMQQSMKLASQLQHVHETLSCDKAWLSKITSRERNQRTFEDPSELGLEGASGSGL